MTLFWGRRYYPQGSTHVDPASGPTVVGDTDRAAFVAAAHDGQQSTSARMLQDDPHVLVDVQLITQQNTRRCQRPL